MSEAQNPRRHRRLDLSAVARGLLPGQARRIRKSSNMPSRQFGAIEINATFYGRQSPKSWENVGKAVPDGFQFAIKGSRYCVTRPRLADARRRLGIFFAQGLSGARRQARPVPVDARRAPQVRPRRYRRVPRLASRKSSTASRCATRSSRATKASATSLLRPVPRRMTSPSCSAIDDEFPCIDADTASFAYARLQRMREDVPTGYDDRSLDALRRARSRKWRKDGRDATSS